MKILATDYDGTLRQQQRVDKADILAIKKWRKNDNIFGIVSGRSMESIISEIALHNFEVDFMIGNNGGVIYDLNKKHINTQFMNGDSALKIMEYLCSENAVKCFHTNDGYGRSRFEYPYNSENRSRTKQECRDNKVAQIVVSIQDIDELKKIAKYISEHFGDEVEPFMNIDCIDIVPKGVDKAIGLGKLIEYYQWNNEDVYTIGDSHNDLPMLLKYQGCAIKSGIEEVTSTISAKVESVGELIEQLLK